MSVGDKRSKTSFVHFLLIVLCVPLFISVGLVAFFDSVVIVFFDIYMVFDVVNVFQLIANRYYFVVCHSWR